MDSWTQRALDNVDAHPGKYRCSPYVAQVVSAYRPERHDDAIVEPTWKTYGETSRRENHWRVEEAVAD